MDSEKESNTQREFRSDRERVRSGPISSLKLQRNEVRSGTFYSFSLCHGQKERQREDGKKYPYSHCVHQIVVQIPPRSAQDQELDIGARHFDVTESVPDIPVPLRAETVAETIEDTQAKPGKGCQHNGSEMKIAGFLADPPEQYEQDEGGMEYKEEDVDE